MGGEHAGDHANGGMLGGSLWTQSAKEAMLGGSLRTEPAKPVLRAATLLTLPRAGPDPAARYALGELAETVDHFVVTLGLDHFSLGGNSMGGGVAWHYALAHPDKVDRLVLVDAYAYPQPPPAMMKLFTLPVVGHVATWVTPRFAVERSVRDVYGDPSRVTEAGVDRYHELLLREGNREATRQRLSTRRDDGLTARLGELRAPTLILWGTLDRWILPQNGERLARDIPGAKLVMLDGLGHVPMEEDPARSVAPVVVFLR